MGQARARQRLWAAYARAGCAVAVALGCAIQVGDIDLDVDYVTNKLEEIGSVYGLDLKTEQIATLALLPFNWSALAQVEAGRPRSFLLGENLGRFAGNDALGVIAMRRHWRVIEAVAENLLKSGRLCQAEILELIRSFGADYDDANHFGEGAQETP